MKSKESKHNHYDNRQAIIASLSGVDEEFDQCVACANRKYCWGEKELLCPPLSDRYWKPVKIRKVIMKKIIKRRKNHEK